MELFDFTQPSLLEPVEVSPSPIKQEVRATLRKLERQNRTLPWKDEPKAPAKGSAASMAGKITEIILQDEDEYNFQLLMPLLAQLSQDDRWFAWIAPPKKMPKQWLLEAGIDINKIIVLQPGPAHDAMALARRALSTGTCHAVISWPGAIAADEFEDLKAAAQSGASHAILVRPR